MESNKQETSEDHEKNQKGSLDKEALNPDALNPDAMNSEQSDAESPESFSSENEVPDETVELTPEEEKAFLLDQLQRAHAELANFRRRTLEDRASQRKRTTVDVVRSFLPVLDGLDAAIKAVNEAGEDSSIRQGLEMIAERVNGVLTDLKVEQIATSGKDFDPEIHEAMMQIDNPNARQGEIVDEVEKGYRCGDLLIRASRVIVARGGDSSDESEGGEDANV
ncbi:MAG: nucleotide exchange factor GrpE [Planctomycetia bacterium]|nr:nucleotide exchange factor GrpE [Planctomycetia bacterium]